MARLFGLLEHTDARIVAQVLAGHRNDFAVLVDRYYNALFALARVETGNRADAQDAVQDAFLKAFLSLDKLRERDKFAPWLFSIARNAARSLRETRRRLARPVPVNLEATVTPRPEQNEMHALLRDQLDALDEKDREVLVLHYFAGLSLREAAHALGISREAAAKRLQRARDTLGERLIQTLGAEYTVEPKTEDQTRRVMGIVLAATPNWTAKAAAASLAWSIPTGTSLLATVAVVAAGLGSWYLMRLPATPIITPTATAPEAQQEAPEPPDPVAPYASEAPASSQPEPQTTASTEAANAPAAPALPKGNYVLAGFVITADGKLVPSADVELYRREPDRVFDTPRFLAKVNSDASGQFTFTGLAKGYYTVIATDGVVAGSKGAAVQRIEVQYLSRYGRTWIVLDPTPTGSMAGRVESPSGDPVPGAHVRPFNPSVPSWDQPYSRTAGISDAVTDDNGNFVLSSLPARSWTLAAEAPGRTPALTRPLPAGIDDVRIVLGDGGLEYSGRCIYPDGSPAAGVSLALYSGKWDTRSAVTDASGAFRFDRLASNQYWLDTKCDSVVLNPWKDSSRYEFYPFKFIAVTPRLADNHLQDNTIQVQAAGSITGRIADRATGRGVAGLDVFAAFDGPWPGGTNSAATGPDGRYTINRLRIGKCQVGPTLIAGGQAADYAGYSPLEGAKPLIVNITSGSPAAADFLVSGGPASLSGIVKDGKGRPLHGAQIIGLADARRRYGISDEHGRFRLDGLPAADRLVMYVARAGYITQKSKKTFLPASGLSGLEFVLEPAACFIGLVKDAHGQSVSGLSLSCSLRTEDGGLEPLDDTDRSSTEGLFFFDGLAAGAYVVTPAGRTETDKPFLEVPVPDAAIVTGITLKLPPEHSLTIAGVVTDSSGALEDAYVMVRGPVALDADEIAAQIQTDKDGRFTARGLSPGSYKIQVDSNAGHTTQNDIPAGSSDIHIQMPDPHAPLPNFP